VPGQRRYASRDARSPARPRASSPRSALTTPAPGRAGAGAPAAPALGASRQRPRPPRPRPPWAQCRLTRRPAPPWAGARGILKTHVFEFSRLSRPLGANDPRLPAAPAPSPRRWAGPVAYVRWPERCLQSRIVSQKNQQQTLRFKQQTLRLRFKQQTLRGRAGPAARDAPRRRSGRAGRATGGSGPGCAATAEVAVMKAGPPARPRAAPARDAPRRRGRHQRRPGVGPRAAPARDAPQRRGRRRRRPGRAPSAPARVNHCKPASSDLHA
jgi:hypothetical protein